MKLETWAYKKDSLKQTNKKPAAIICLCNQVRAYAEFILVELFSITSEKGSEFLGSSITTPVHKIHTVIRCDLYSI